MSRERARRRRGYECRIDAGTILAATRVRISHRTWHALRGARAHRGAGGVRMDDQRVAGADVISRLATHHAVLIEGTKAVGKTATGLTLCTSQVRLDRDARAPPEQQDRVGGLPVRAAGRPRSPCPGRTTASPGPRLAGQQGPRDRRHRRTARRVLARRGVEARRVAGGRRRGEPARAAPQARPRGSHRLQRPTRRRRR